MRRRLLLGLVPLAPFALLFGACESRPVALGLSLSFPQGLLDQATSVDLSVFDASLATCSKSTGVVSAIPAGGATQTFPLGTTGCASGDAWCTTLTLDKDGSTKMFAVVAKRADTTLAEGCTTVAIDQDSLVVDIQAYRYLAPKCCNDGILEPGEQCDTGVPGSCDATPPTKCGGVAQDAVCFCDCTAREILLSHDDAQAPFLKNAPAGSKVDLALSFGPGGASNPSMLRAVYESNDPANATGIDLHASYLGEDLYPISDPFPLSLQLQFPVRCSSVEGESGTVGDQRFAAIATAAYDTVAVVYQSDEDNGGEFDVFLSPQIVDGCVDTKPCTQKSDCQTDCDPNAKTCLPAIKLNTIPGGTSEPRIAAGPSGTVLVTWTRVDGVFGRIWRTDGTTVPAIGEISIAEGGSAARVAGSPSGFLVVYQGPGVGDPDGVFLRPVDPSGTVGDEVPVNTLTAGVQDQPDIAMLDDGAALVVWRSGGDIYFQHFDATGKEAADDQSAPLNTVGAGDATVQQNPAVAGANGYFTVAWETPDPMTGKGNISARFVAEGTGFGYNSVSGQNDEFVATDPLTAGDRYHPAVAMSAFVAIGWEDHSSANSGVYVRRFPPPAQ
jgi:hypothetical protein